jgi:hypothetical protein
MKDGFRVRDRTVLDQGHGTHIFSSVEEVFNGIRKPVERNLVLELNENTIVSHFATPSKGCTPNLSIRIFFFEDVKERPKVIDNGRVLRVGNARVLLG